MNREHFNKLTAKLKVPALHAAISLLAGTLYAAALAPFNIELLAFFTLVPLLWVIERSKPLSAALYGWLWGIGWGFFAYRFLREIDAVIPFLLPPVIAIWSALWACAVSFINKRTKNKNSFWYLTLTVFGTAALFTLIEWTRSRLFVWNDLGVTQWRNLPLIQLAAFTGSYGVNFIVALGNTAIYALISKGKRRAAIIPLCLILLVITLGYFRLKEIEKPSTHSAVWKPILIQGDLSQRRRASLNQVQEALDIYGTLTLQAINKYPGSNFIIWPESAIPLTFYSAIDMRKFTFTDPYALNTLRYQELIRLITSNYRCRMLFGALDIAPETPGSRNFVATNSALFFDENGVMRRKYSKIHRVPFGEYIPFRNLLPKFITNYIDMGRDIVSGTDSTPLVLAPGVNAGVVICYEGVFGYITRKSAQNGANVLIALSNDAWYPQSSEPEQHLANVVMRCVETGLYMVRSGNNGGSGVVTPSGRFTQCYTPESNKRPELWRGRTINRVEVPISQETARTLYVRWGEYFIIILAAIVILWIVPAFYRREIKQ